MINKNNDMNNKKTFRGTRKSVVKLCTYLPTFTYLTCISEKKNKHNINKIVVIIWYFIILLYYTPNNVLHDFFSTFIEEIINIKTIYNM